MSLKGTKFIQKDGAVLLNREVTAGSLPQRRINTEVLSEDIRGRSLPTPAVFA